MPSQRLGLCAWLEEKLEKREFSGLKWLDKTKGQFIISWIHASRHGWRQSQDAALFKAWAVYTGRFAEGEEPNPKTWKANFRCAVNASSDISLVKSKSLCKGKNAHRVYVFSRKRKSKRFVATRNPGLRLSSVTTKLNINMKEEEENDYERKYTPRPSRTRNRQVKENQSQLSNDHCESENKTENNLQNSAHVDEKITKQEPEMKIDLSKIKIEDEEIENCGKKIYDSKLYSFKELLEKIPQIGFGRPASISLPTIAPDNYEHHQASPDFVYNKQMFLEKIDDELIERLAAEITVDRADGNDDHDYDFEEILHHAEIADSASDSDDDPMHEMIFDDCRSYRSFSGSSVSDDNWRFDQTHDEIDGHFEEAFMMSQHYVKMPADGSNDPFLSHGMNQKQNDLASALTQYLSQEVH